MTQKTTAKPWCTIADNADFQVIYKSGQRHFTKTIGVFIKRHDAVAPPRLGFVASAAKAGNAVKRNFAKRRMRALAKKHISATASADYDYVLIATAQTTQAAYADLEKDLQNALRRLQVLS